jgi:hypothetical protein
LAISADSTIRSRLDEKQTVAIMPVFGVLIAPQPSARES